MDVTHMLSDYHIYLPCQGEITPNEYKSLDFIHITQTPYVL